jgi:site-specific recombinase XerD
MTMARASDTPAFAPLLQDYFCQRLIAQRDASPATIASYRDTFRLLLGYARDRIRKKPTDLALVDIDAPLVLGFLAHLERDRGNSPRTRNARFAAIRSFLQFAAVKCPASLPSIQRVLAIPMKRFDRRVLGFLTREEVKAIIDAPDCATWTGRRDRAMFSAFYNTGARISEIANACVADVSPDRRRCLRVHGKGRKERIVPLWSSTCRLLSAWLRETSSSPNAPLFPARDGGRLSRSGIEDRLASALATAVGSCPSLRDRRVSPHTLRHTTAMHLLQSGVDVTVIALWLGHENPATTHTYVEADLAMKRRALDKLADPRSRAKRLAPSDALLAFLDGL